MHGQNHIKQDWKFAYRCYFWLEFAD